MIGAGLDPLFFRRTNGHPSLLLDSIELDWLVVFGQQDDGVKALLPDLSQDWVIQRVGEKANRKERFAVDQRSAGLVKRDAGPTSGRRGEGRQQRAEGQQRLSHAGKSARQAAAAPARCEQVA